MFFGHVILAISEHAMVIQLSALLGHTAQLLCRLPLSLIFV